MRWSEITPAWNSYRGQKLAQEQCAVAFDPDIQHKSAIHARYYKHVSSPGRCISIETPDGLILYLDSSLPMLKKHQICYNSFLMSIWRNWVLPWGGVLQTLICGMCIRVAGSKSAVTFILLWSSMVAISGLCKFVHCWAFIVTKVFGVQ